MTPAPDSASSILIVDDMEENLVALEAVLGPLAQVVRARSGEEALKAMLRQEFAVVLLDVMMPGMDGFETAANIKGLDQTKDVPVILLTGAEVDPDYAYRGYTVGAADFLVKPFDPWLLRTKVGVFLDLHRKNRQLAAQAEQLKRLLTADRRPGGGAGARAAGEVGARTAGPGAGAGAGSPAGSAGPAGPAGWAASAGPAGSAGPAPTGGDGAGERSGDTARLAEIAGRLAQLELLIRETEGPEPTALADRIAELEHTVGTLLTAPGPDHDADRGSPGPSR